MGSSDFMARCETDCFHKGPVISHMLFLKGKLVFFRRCKGLALKSQEYWL